MLVVYRLRLTASWMLEYSVRDCFVFFFSSRRRHTRCSRDWSSDVCSSDLVSSGIRGFFVARFLLGIGEAPTFPGNAKAVGYWFPSSERSLATAIFDAAAKLDRKSVV